MDWLRDHLEIIGPIIVALLTLLVGAKVLVRRQKQTQTGGKKSRNMQAGRDINLGKNDDK
jgi:hypothetical protein